MNEQKSRVVCVGEVMIELARGADGRFALGCGGDTFNTAIYLARAGIDVDLRPRSGTIPIRTAFSRWPPPRASDSDLVLHVRRGDCPGSI